MIIYVAGVTEHSKKKVGQYYFASEYVLEDEVLLDALLDHAQESLEDFADESVKITGVQGEIDGFEVIKIR
jgi:hypothetical protein